MQRLLGTFGLAWALLVWAAPAAAAPITIDFDDPALTPGTEVEDFYDSLGVTFIDASVALVTGYYYNGGDTTSNMLYHTTEGGDPMPDNPIEAVFNTAVSSVSLDGYGVGLAGFRLSAYDALGVLLGSQEIFSGGQPNGNGTFNHFTLALNVEGIQRIAFSQYIPGTSDSSVFFDNLTFSHETPEPGTLALLSAGVLGKLLVMRRRRRT